MLCRSSVSLPPPAAWLQGLAMFHEGTEDVDALSKFLNPIIA